MVPSPLRTIIDIFIIHSRYEQTASLWKIGEDPYSILGEEWAWKDVAISIEFLIDPSRKGTAWDKYLLLNMLVNCKFSISAFRFSVNVLFTVRWKRAIELLL